MLLPDSNDIDFVVIFRLMYNDERRSVGTIAGLCVAILILDSILQMISFS